MSVEAAKRFCLQMGSDSEFLNELISASSVDDHFRVARNAGYDFTVDEYETAAEEILQADDFTDVLDDQDEIVGYMVTSFLNIQQTVRSFYGDGGISGAAPRTASLTSAGALQSGPCVSWFRG